MLCLRPDDARRAAEIPSAAPAFLIPENHINGDRRFLTSLIFDDEGGLTAFSRERFPGEWKIDVMLTALLPHAVPWSLNRNAPLDWMAANVQGCWRQWTYNIHFSHANDAFAFKMRWL